MGIIFYNALYHKYYFNNLINIKNEPIKILYLIMKFLLIFIISCGLSMNTVENLDLEKFMGKWYVISNIPNFIEKNHQNSYDIYSLNENGTIDISYFGEKNGKIIHLKQNATVTDTINNSSWKIRLTKPYIPFFRAPYKVIILDKNYDYMVVGYKNNTLGWVMSRNKIMSEEIYDNIMNELENNFNYKRNNFNKIIHK